MQSKLSFLSLVFFVSFVIVSCSKNDTPVTPPKPEVFDSLGAGWSRVKIDTTLSLEDIFFVNNQTGFLCGKNYLGKSTDGGLTWQRIIPDSLNQPFINLFFVDANNGWVTCKSFLLRTRDGGATWQKAYNGEVYDVQFFDANNGYITVLQKGLYKTSDGGLTLQSVKQNSASGYAGLFFANQNKGWFCQNYLMKTVNGGVDISQSTTQVSSNGVYAIQFTDDLHGWLAGGGPVVRTVDGGNTFETIISTQGAGDISFFDNNNGFVMADNSIYSTADGGKTLSKLSTVRKASLIEFHFTDPGHGWATGGGGYVYRYVKP